MITKEQVDSILKSKRKIDFKNEKFNSFSKSYQILGKLVVGHLPKYRNTKPIIEYYKDAFGKDLNENPWDCKEGLKLATLIYGELRAPYISKMWALFMQLPFQSGYNRRPFRIAISANHISNAIVQFRNLSNTSFYGFADCTFKEQAQLVSYYQNMGNAYLFAVVLQEGNKELLETITDIIQGEDEIGSVSRDIIKALLLTDKKENWQLVESLLLAAQRQEGLRQTILETLDETSIGALRYLINTVLEHDLMRFSSVVRGVDTWFGFGWDAPKKATIKRTLELAATFIDAPEKVDNAIQSKDFLESYVALWSIGIKNVSVANTKAFDLVYDDTVSKNKKLLALKFIYQTKKTKCSLAPYMIKNWGKDVELDYWMLLNAASFEWTADFFEKVKITADQLPADGKWFGGSVFEWHKHHITPHYFYNYLIRYAEEEQMIFLAEDLAKLPNNARETFMRKMFPKHYTYSLSTNYYQNQKKEIPKLNFEKGSWQRTLLQKAVTDRNGSVMATGFQGFRYMDLQREELEILEGLLSRKGKDLRKNTIQLLLKQPEDQLKTSTKNLITSSKIDQRLAALEILSVLDEEEKYPVFVDQQVAIYKERKSLNKNEEVFILKFSKEETSEYNFANGFGVIDYTNLSPLIVPKAKFQQKKSLLSFTKPKSSFKLKGLVDEKKTVTAINKLIQIFEENRNYEYQYEGYQGAIETVLLGEIVTIKIKDYKGISNEDYLNNLPLADLWKKWYKQSKLNDFEMHYAIYFLNAYGDPFSRFSEMADFIRSYYPNLKDMNIDKTGNYQSINRKIGTIVSALHRVYRDEMTIINFKIDVFEDMIAQCPEEFKTRKLKSSNTYYNDRLIWTNKIKEAGFWLSEQEIDVLMEKNQALVKRYYDLNFYLFAQYICFPKPVNNLSTVTQKKNTDRQINPPHLHILISLYKKGLLPKENVLFQALYEPDLFRLLDGGLSYRTKQYKEVNLSNIGINQLKKNMLEVEVERGDLTTEASEYIRSFVKVKGVSYVFEILERLGKENLDRGYSYNLDSKKVNFSTILSISVPSETDTYEVFAKGIAEAKITKKRLMEVACYATQWAEWIGRYLKIDNLENAIWWFHAHASDFMNAQKETVVARYSNITKSDFANGAIDIDWFNRVYTSLGKANWKVLHDAAKYISQGNGHRQVKLYSSVMLGEVKITATLKKINEKRDKDYLRALGLIPLSKANAEKDLLNRYNLIQTFLKESKQFGAQRQESERKASEIALDNLSRNAGFEDRIRFGWAMEGKATEKIMENDTVVFDDVTIKLVVNDQGKADIKVFKGEKSQKTIPAKYKKDKKVQQLKEGKSYLSKQYSRTRLSLENAMVRGDVFNAEELEKIMLHPVVKAMLGKLVLFNVETKESGFYKAGSLINAENKVFALKPNGKLVIAHASHLYEAVQWDLYQKYLFENRIVQPFKQVFRELYVITADEKEHSFRSERYQGHQIQPKKTVALLRSRGWTVNRDEGLQKVYHKQGFMATMYAMADWFSPADVEAPTLEYVCFHSLKDYKPLPMTEIPPVLFSEVMRDVDLVVSVAHVGGVDPEASHSTMEMRGVLARESARLFKLDNIEVKIRHIIIKGKLAEYSLHLGSANVSKKGLALHIIPVHSQHRGRVFLPFVDDDPKTAELISKMKLLAEDHKIQDPTVLAQINKG
ncbi:DUF4132 domain-containing protein [uncultured Maribacter sp.]|uniref:DUF4132 domain-containing protein n=1 Tax=uncultured Maribacter sp. TaxID=431308 RepID=UPI00262AF0DA|nr:DUF4132 domain-containing protein [uncultured Maribacter sp.]